jgi:hypothetical protein
MFIPHRKHSFVPPRPITGKASHFKCGWYSYITGNTPMSLNGLLGIVFFLHTNRRYVIFCCQCRYMNRQCFKSFSNFTFVMYSTTIRVIYMYILVHINIKKTISVSGREGLLGCEIYKVIYFIDNRLTYGGNSASLTIGSHVVVIL